MLIQEEKLLQGFFDCNSHGNGHADHGVVTCAQEAHHLNVKIHLRWLLHWGTTGFPTGSPDSDEVGDTST